MWEIRDYLPEDFLLLCPRLWAAEKRDIVEWCDSDASLQSFAAHLRANGLAWTIWEGALPIAVFGIILVSDRHGEAWLWFGPEMKGKKDQLEGTLGTYLKIAMGEMGLEKVTTGAIAGYEHLMGWIERMGFQKTGTVHDGKTEHVRYELWQQLQQ